MSATSGFERDIAGGPLEEEEHQDVLADLEEQDIRDAASNNRTVDDDDDDVLMDEVCDADPNGSDEEQEDDTGHIQTHHNNELVDVPVPDLHTLYPSLATPALSPSNEKRMKTIYRYWVCFCATVGRPPLVDKLGLNLYPELALEEHTYPSRSNCYDAKLLEDFFGFLVNQPEITHDKMTRASTFIHAHLKSEFYIRVQNAGFHAVLSKDICLSNNHAIQGHRQWVRKRKNQMNVENYIDLQSDMDNEITKAQRQLFFQSTFDQPIGPCVAKMSKLKRITFACTLNASMQDLRRGEEHVGQMLSHRFVRVISTIGPQGTECSMTVTNKGKANQVGRIEYTGKAPHLDPRCDTSSMHGILWLFRFVANKEPFPNFLEYRELFAEPTYKADRVDSLGTRSMQDLFRQYFADADVDVGKLTHQGRRQGSQEMDLHGCSMTDISRMTGHAKQGRDGTRAQNESYVTNPPVTGMVQRAGGEPKHPRSHQPPWCSVEVPLELLELVFPMGLDMQRKVHHAYSQTSSHRERKEKRLCAAKGSINAMLLDVKRSIQMMASRPLDPETGCLLESEPSIRMLYEKGAFCDVFGLDALRSPAFTAFEADVFEAQKSYYNGVLVEKERSTAMERAVNELHREVHHLRRDQRLLFSQQGQIIDLLRQQMSGVPAFTSTQGEELTGRRRLGEEDDYDSLGSQQYDNNNNHQSVLCLPEIPAAAEDTLANGSSPRKRRRPISQEAILIAEAQRGISSNGCPRPVLADNKRRRMHIRDHWRAYKMVYRPLEQEWGYQWRADVKHPTRREVKSSKKTFWCIRLPIYRLVEFFLTESSDDEEEALSKCDQFYSSLPTVKTGKVALRDLSKACRSKLIAEDFAIVCQSKKRQRTATEASVSGAASFSSTIVQREDQALVETLASPGVGQGVSGGDDGDLFQHHFGAPYNSDL